MLYQADDIIFDLRMLVNDTGKKKYSDVDLTSNINQVLQLIYRYMQRADSTVGVNTVSQKIDASDTVASDINTERTKSINFSNQPAYAFDLPYDYMGIYKIFANGVISDGNQMVNPDEYIVIGNVLYSAYPDIIMQYFCLPPTFTVGTTIDIPSDVYVLIARYTADLVMNRQAFYTNKLHDQLEDEVIKNLKDREYSFIHRDPPFGVYAPFYYTGRGY